MMDLKDIKVGGQTVGVVILTGGKCFGYVEEYHKHPEFEQRVLSPVLKAEDADVTDMGFFVDGKLVEKMNMQTKQWENV